MTAQRIVREYLDAMQRRDLESAKALLAPNFEMTFPGGHRFRQLEELIAWSAPRYRRVAKRYERFDELIDSRTSVVYCFGVLHGEWPDGTPFDNIRFIDRFTVVDGKLVDQQVWNDMGA